MNDDWTLAQTLFGVTTYYRREQDGSLSIKLEGRLDGVPLFEQVAVLREVDLHHKWAPFVSSSLTVAHLDKLDTVGWFVVGLPNFGLMRDACFRAIGCDCMAEDGSILLVGQGIDDRPEDNKENDNGMEENEESIPKKALPKTPTEAPINYNRYLANDPVLKELDLPEVPQRIGGGRMTIRSFNGIIHVESPTSVRTRIIANIDPNLSFLPQSLLEFVMKKMCGVLLSKLQSAAKRITKDPVRNAHARKMRLEREFYQSWLVPKFEGQCNRQGWTMPPVSAFNLTEEEQEQERAYEEQQRAKKNKKLFHSLDDLDKVDRHDFDDGGSGHSEPQGYGYNASSPESVDSDTVSALSMNSSTTMSSAWKNNPIANYLREVEAKTQMRKEEEIRRSRERAAKRLQPKVLDPMKQSRLAELRAAKNRRRILDYSRTSSSLSVTSSVSSVNDEMKSSSRSDGITSRSLPPSLVVADLTTSQRQLVTDSRRLDLAIVWTEHGMIMRVLVTSVLMGLLFSALYKENFFGVSTKETLFTLRQNETGPWYMPIARDAGTIAFMWALATIHFSFCYVSLMYAFSALQLGDIAGRHAKKFYSQNVHVMVAAASGSMVFLGIFKSMLSVMFRILVWRSIWLFGFVKAFASTCGNFLWGEDDGLLTDLNEVIMSILDALPLVGRVPAAVMNFVLLPAYHACRNVLDAVISLSSSFYWLVFQSNAVGRLLDRAVTYVFGGVTSIYTIWTAFVNDIVDRNEGRIEMHSWREDAFQTTRILLSYSAVFLLTLLLIFNLSAKKARKGGTYEDLTEKAPVSTPSNAQSEEIKTSVRSPEPDMVEELNDTSNSFLSPSAKSLPPIPRGTPMRRRAPTFDSIAEEPFFYDAVEHSENTNIEEEETALSMSSKNMKRGFRLRRRRRRTGSADDVNSRRGRSYSIS